MSEDAVERELLAPKVEGARLYLGMGLGGGGSRCAKDRNELAPLADASLGFVFCWLSCERKVGIQECAEVGRTIGGF